ncbi:MAG: hypothetical protein V2A62_00250 [Candidatus Woesearchaeota archaeon]
MEITELFEKNERGLWTPKYRLGDIVELKKIGNTEAAGFYSPELTLRDLCSVGRDNPENFFSSRVGYYGGMFYSLYNKDCRYAFIVIYHPPIDEKKLEPKAYDSPYLSVNFSQTLDCMSKIKSMAYNIFTEITDDELKKIFNYDLFVNFSTGFKYLKDKHCHYGKYSLPDESGLRQFSRSAYNDIREIESLCKKEMEIRLVRRDK